MRDGLHHPIRFHKFIKHILQKIFGIDFIRNASANEREEPPPFRLESPRQALVLRRMILGHGQPLYPLHWLDEIAAEKL